MSVERELRELDRLWCEGTSWDEFWRKLRSGSWGQRIRETVVAGIRRSDPQAIEDAVVFLEVAPRYFRSGYYRGWIARALKSAPLTADQCRRLRKVLLRDVVSRRIGPEFCELARLAVVVADDDFLSRLRHLFLDLPPWARRRRDRMLELCARRPRPDASSPP